MTLGVAFQHRLVLYVVGDILGREQRQPDTGKQAGRLLPPESEVKVHPVHEGLEDNFLAGHIQVVGGDNGLQLTGRQQQELLVADDLLKVVLRVLASAVAQLNAGLRVREEPDTDAVGGMEELAKEDAAGVYDGWQLEQARR